MDESNIKNELKAIETITNTLGPLDKTAQQRVLQYAVQHLGLQVEQANLSPQVSQKQTATGTGQPTLSPRQQVVDIRTLREQKRPSSDMEMAAIVAYYLSELAPEENQKDAIGAEDIETYFKQARYPVPKGYRFTLINARAAGYFESAGHGKYKLNPVGHNLVAHSLPRVKGKSTLTSPRKKRKKKKKAKSSKKKTAKKAR